MKRIALIGAPGSGKSALAGALAKKLNARDELSGDEEFVIIDSYVEELGVRTGLAFGNFSTYLGNLLVAAERIEREFHAKNEERHNSITCGTIIETTVYQAIFGQQMPEDANKREVMQARMALVMQTLGMIIYDTFRYDHIFLLDLVDEDVDRERRDFVIRVDQEIKDCLAQFDIPATTLTGTLEERVERALETIEHDEAQALLEATPSVE